MNATIKTLLWSAAAAYVVVMIYDAGKLPGTKAAAAAPSGG